MSNPNDGRKKVVLLGGPFLNSFLFVCFFVKIKWWAPSGWNMAQGRCIPTAVAQKGVPRPRIGFTMPYVLHRTRMKCINLLKYNNNKIF